MLTLILKEGDEPHTLNLSQDVVTMGRSKENVIVIRNIKASRHHAKIERVGGTYQITDLGSGNGTKVNGEKIDFQTLKAGDEIKIGDASLTLKSIDDAVESDDSTSDQPTEQIDLEADGDLKIDADDELKIEGEELPEVEVELEAEKIEIQDDAADVPVDERETEIAIKPAPAPAKPAPRAMLGKPAPAPARPAPAPAKPAEGERKPGLLKRPTLGERFKKKP
jgi:predicted component of type VI protein secretion system